MIDRIMSPPSLLWSAGAVGLGAAAGALLRWQLGAWLNAKPFAVPAGTLAANVLGGYLAGLALAWFSQHQDVSPIWRLLVITGFLGGLTTFSTFSLEMLAQLQAGRIGTALSTAALHLLGALAATWAGWATWGGSGR
jgi:CrcB protein